MHMDVISVEIVQQAHVHLVVALVAEAKVALVEVLQDHQHHAVKTEQELLQMHMDVINVKIVLPALVHQVKADKAVEELLQLNVQQEKAQQEHQHQ